jgi:hypothetical protein
MTQQEQRRAAKAGRQNTRVQRGLSQFGPPSLDAAECALIVLMADGEMLTEEQRASAAYLRGRCARYLRHPNGLNLGDE